MGLLFPVWCAGCGAPGEALCVECGPERAAAIDFAVGDLHVRAAGSYDGPLREVIVAMKHGERPALAALVPLLARLVPRGAAIVPLPTTRRRRNARGFDQALELAHRAAALTGGAVYPVLGKRGAAQAGLARIRRLAAQGRFTLRRGAVVPARAIVLDDVCTTGATIRDAVACLRAAGVRVDGAVVVARTPPGRNQPDSRAVLTGV